MLSKENVMAFLQKILECSKSEQQAAGSLNELARILSEQGAPDDLVELVTNAGRSIPEASQAAKTAQLDDEALKIAYERAERRRERELEARRRQGRC